MNNIYIKSSAANSLVVVPMLLTIMLGQNYQEILIDKNYNLQTNIREVFHRLPSQNIRLEQNQMDILASFVSKLVNESKDLDGEIVDMVNKHFWDLI